MGPRHDRDVLLAAAADLVAEVGLSQLTFGRLAKRLGISDRMLVYYFPTKDDLLVAVLHALSERLQAALAPAFAAPVEGCTEAVRAAWPVLTDAENDAAFALFFEAAGLAAAGREPYRTAVEAFVEQWVNWVATLLRGTPARRRSEAEAVVALVDGLLLLRRIGGPEAAERAFRRLTR
ncbi:MAG: TetR family transcriptional regulator [Sporichthyaceae bacterium]